MTHSHSDTRIRTPARHLALAVFGVLAVALPLLPVFGALITTDRYIVREEEPATEDQYVTSTSALVEGRIDGDLTVFTGSLTISGTVTGNVTVFSAGSVTIEESGTVDGSVHGAAPSVTVRGTVGSDMFIAAGSTVVEQSGTVGRDVMAFGGTVRIEGTVERDVRGRAYRTTVDGTVGGDVDIATQSFGISSTAVIGGDVLYRSASEASISDEATIGGTVTKLPSQSNFLYGIVLTIANIVSFLGFIVSGLVVLWLARSTGSRAVGAMLTKPLRAFLAGVGTVIVVPILIALLAVTLVGIPLAIALLAGAVVLFIVGAVPAVTALGHLILVKRGGLFGAFLVGAVVWRLSIFIPWLGPFLFLLALVWGIGAWVLGVLAARRSDPLPPALVPAALVARGERAPDWEPPLAPGSVASTVVATTDERTDDADEQLPAANAAVDDDDASDDAGGAVGEEDGPGAEDTPDSGEGDASVSTTADTPDDVVDGRIVFGAGSAAESVPDALESDGPQPDAAPDAGMRGSDGGDDVPAEHADDDQSAEDGDQSLSERFAALREELLTTGTVEPVERGDDEPGDDDDDPPASGSVGSEWGLKD